MTPHSIHTQMPTLRVPGRGADGRLGGRRGALLATVLIAGLCVLSWTVTRHPGIQHDLHRFLFFGRWEAGATLGNLVATYLAVWAMAWCWSRRRRLLGQRFLLTSGSIVMTIGMLELPAYLGLVDYRNIVRLPEQVLFTQQKPWHNPANRVDPELLHLHRPHHAFAGSSPGDLVYLLGIPTDRTYPVDLRFDQNGFRNDTDLDRADVVLIGDSFLETGLVSYESTLGPLLERATGQVVANLGQSGYGPQQERITLERFGLPLQPRVVLWFFFEGNDLRDAARYRRARENWDAYLWSNRTPGMRSLLSCVYTTLAFHTQSLTREPGGLALRRSGTLPDTGERMYFAFVGEALDQTDEQDLRIAQQEIHGAQELCRDRDVRFALVFVPTKYRVYADLLDFDESSECRDWVLSDLPGRLREFAAGHGIPFLDLTPALGEAATTGPAVYFPDDGHWNENGCGVASVALGELLETMGGR